MLQGTRIGGLTRSKRYDMNHEFEAGSKVYVHRILSVPTKPSTIVNKTEKKVIATGG